MSKERESQPHRLTIDMVSHVAKEVLVKQGSHAPMLYVDGSKQGIVVELSTMLETATKRIDQMFMTGYHIAQETDVGELEQVFFISEAWLNKVENPKDVNTPPSQSPKRTEVLIISNVDLLEDQSRMVVYEMIRDDNEKLIDVERLIQAEETEFDAPLVETFIAGFDAPKDPAD